MKTIIFFLTFILTSNCFAQIDKEKTIQLLTTEIIDTTYYGDTMQVVKKSVELSTVALYYRDTIHITYDDFYVGDYVRILTNDTLVYIQHGDTLVISLDMYGLVNSMCGEFSTTLSIGTDDYGTIADRVENRIINHLGIEKDADGNYMKEVADFWNANSQNFICTFDDGLAKVRIPQHLMKKAIATSLYAELFYDFLLYEDYGININHIEIYNGEPETVLDYVLHIINDPVQLKEYQGTGYIGRLEEIRKALIYAGAKTAEEILNEEKATNK